MPVQNAYLRMIPHGTVRYRTTLIADTSAEHVHFVRKCPDPLGLCRTYGCARTILRVVEPFGIVMVYLQKRDLEKNGFKDFRHFRTRNLTQTPKSLDVLYVQLRTWLSYVLKVLAH